MTEIFVTRVSQCHNTGRFLPFCMRSQQNCTVTHKKQNSLDFYYAIREEKLNITVFVKLMDSLITFWIKPANASTLLERKKEREGRKWRHYNALLSSREHISFKNVRGRIRKGKGWKSFRYSTIIFLFFWGVPPQIHNTCLRHSQPLKSKRHPVAHGLLEGYKLVDQVQFMLLVIQKGG